MRYRGAGVATLAALSEDATSMRAMLGGLRRDPERLGEVNRGLVELTLWMLGELCTASGVPTAAMLEDMGGVIGRMELAGEDSAEVAGESLAMLTGASISAELLEALMVGAGTRHAAVLMGFAACAAVELGRNHDQPVEEVIRRAVGALEREGTGH